MKAYTDLEQSKKLAKFLPIESADMYWWPTSLRYYIEAMDDGDFNEKEGHIRAWSLAVLLKIIRSACNYELLSIEENKIFGVCKLEISPCRFLTEIYDNELDVCYEMILKLHKLNLL